MSDFSERWHEYLSKDVPEWVADFPVVDAHTHIGRVRWDEPPLTVTDLVEYMNEFGVNRSVLLPLESPEGTSHYLQTETVLEAADRHPDRVIPFCSVDPRMIFDEEGFRDVIESYVSSGARGFGELKAGLPIDDDRMCLLYEICEEYDLPVLFHVDDVCCTDEIGLPNLERVVREYDVDFIMHAHGWWAHISADVRQSDLGSYPSRPVEPGGRCAELLAEYDNLYADFSMGSGFNAITRDENYGQRFLETHQDSLLFGTDFLYPGQKFPQYGFFEQFDLDEQAWRNICHRNLDSILR